jgi:hypothetical protein
MTENHEAAFDEHPRPGSTAPGLEGEGGQYGEGDIENSAEDSREEDAVREGLTDGQVMTTSEERGPLHGDPDADR